MLSIIYPNKGRFIWGFFSTLLKIISKMLPNKELLKNILHISWLLVTHLVQN